MSKYINADALLINLNKGLWGKEWDKALAEAIVNDAPAIDLIRCKDCKHKEYCSKNIAKYGKGYDMYEDIDYCSYGEREE